MAVYAIGDIQGCYKPFRRLLDKIEFDPANDQLLLTGDLVNRGKKSLKVLRYILKHQYSIRTVLGNHDLHMLCAFEGVPSPRGNDTFDDVLNAPERDSIFDWLRCQPLAIHDEALNILLVHAAVHPLWTLDECLSYAGEVQAALSAPDYRKLLPALYGNKPRRWSADLEGADRLRFVVNVFTRLRYIGLDGRLNFDHAGSPGSQPHELVPWFKHPERVSLTPAIVFGHWSALGLYRKNGVLGLDTGCCWGRSLCAARIDVPHYEFTTENCR